MCTGTGRLHGIGEKGRGVLLLSRAWPRRALVYAALKEAGVDVYGVETPEDAAEALWSWPGRFRLLLVDVAGMEAGEVGDALGRARRAGLGGLVVAGPFERRRVPEDLPRGFRVVPKPVSVEALVAAVAEALESPPCPCGAGGRGR